MSKVNDLITQRAALEKRINELNAPKIDTADALKAARALQDAQSELSAARIVLQSLESEIAQAQRDATVERDASQLQRITELQRDERAALVNAVKAIAGNAKAMSALEANRAQLAACGVYPHPLGNDLLTLHAFLMGRFAQDDIGRTVLGMPARPTAAEEQRAEAVARIERAEELLQAARAVKVSSNAEGAKHDNIKRCESDLKAAKFSLDVIDGKAERKPAVVWVDTAGMSQAQILAIKERDTP